MYNLYLKVHRSTHKMYLGYTEKEDINKYPGSGKRWQRHLKKHGNNVKTMLLYSTECKEELKQKGKEYSEKWDVVNSDRFANLKTEEGISGNYGYEARLKMSQNYNYELQKKTWTEERRKKQSIRTSKVNKELWADKEHAKQRGKNISKALTGKKREPRSEEFKKHMSNILTGRSYGKGIKHELKEVTCPHCGKIGKGPNMTRYHFEKCKELKRC